MLTDFPDDLRDRYLPVGQRVYRQAWDQEAPLQAAMLADSFLAAGDMDGAAVWRKVIKAIEVMQAAETDGVRH